MVIISHQFSSKNNGPVLLCKTILRHRTCFLSRSVATDGNDEHVLKIEKNGPSFSSFMYHPKRYFWLVLPDIMIFSSYPHVTLQEHFLIG